MARGHHSSPPATALPKVSFEKVKDEVSQHLPGVHSNQARSFGYNDFSDFRRPDHYIRHIEPLESDLATTVEYDMDEQDQEWLEMVNTDRKKDQLDAVSYETFEIIMDRLEKEWFDLTKNLPKLDLAMPSEDSTCAICDDSEGENSNAIVFCDGCNLAVHQDCYGVPYIPEGQWLCRKCTVSPENPVECALCPNEGGAFKQTIHGEWLHLLCAIWIPETRVANDVFMEPITGLERISKQRWKLRCSICDVREGACIQCAKSSCFLAFHATCARKEKLLLPMKSAQGAEPVTLTCYCERHLPPEQQNAREAALAVDDTHGSGQLTSKSARAYAKTYKPGPPLVPSLVVNRILQYINKVIIRKKIEFVQMICRYWSLKREARRGAPLLKRLHLEPWTASAGAKVQTEEEKLLQLELLHHLRRDLMHVRELADLCRKRETRKLRQMEVIQQILSVALFPHHLPLQLAFEKIVAMDRNDYFKNPVSPTEVPDYFDVIKHPMCWTTIDSKLDNHEYWDVKALRDDIELVLTNALMYNKHGTPFHKTAQRILHASGNIFKDLEQWRNNHPVPPSQPNGQIDEDTLMNIDEDSKPSEDPCHIGDLEPPTEILDLLFSSDAIKDDLNMELDDGPLPSLFNYEFARMKPTPPASLIPTKPPTRSRKAKKRDRKLEAEKLRIRRAEAAAKAAQGGDLNGDDNREEGDIEDSERHGNRDLQAALDASAGFRAPRTRNALAVAAAFEAEARASTSASDSVAEGSRAPRSRRRSPTMQAAVPRVVSDVDNRDSFSMFNAGWILPPDQKRGGRTTGERQTLPPPRKRQKLDHAGSRLSIVSTAPSENQTIRRSPPWGSDPIDIKQDYDEVSDHGMDVAPPQTLAPREYSTKPRSRVMENVSFAGSAGGDGGIEAPHNVVTQPNGVVIIEKLDTPAIRRERNMRKKAEKRKLAGGESTYGGSAPNSSRSARPSRKTGGDDDDDLESELSDLSESPSEEKEGGREREGGHKVEMLEAKLPSVSTSTVIRHRKSKAFGRRSSRTEVYLDGTLVWAKADSYPWWPAVVHGDDNTEVPPNILLDHTGKRQKRKIKLYIVQFYDKQASWQSVAREKLQLLGEDREFDEEMLSSTKQKYKNGTVRQLCREAYNLALAAMEVEGEDDPGASGSNPNDTPEATY